MRNFLIGLGVFAATLLAYTPALRAGFIWNDADYVTAPALRSTEGLARIWFELGATEQYYPVLHSAFWVQHRLWGDSATGYHVLNVLLHAACACLLAVVLRRLWHSHAPAPGVGPDLRAGPLGVRTPAARPEVGPYQSSEVPWIAAFLFALHPVCVESVAWISEQKNTLSLFFYLLAALAYLRFDRTRRPRDYLIATAVFVVGLLSKSTTATLPPALLVVFWWRRGRIDWRRDAGPLIAWFALGAAMGLFSAYVERKYIGAEGAEFALTAGQRALLAGRIAWFYLGKLLWPGDLIFIYPRWHVDPAQAWQWGFSLGAVALVAGLWLLRRRWRGPLAAVLFFGGSLFPVLGFFNVYAFIFSFVADHWQYLPSLGILVGGAVVLARRLRPMLIALLIAALGLLTFHQSRMYADMRTFYRTTLARNPQAWMAHNNLGNLLREDGDFRGAIRHFEAALRVRPDLVKVHNNLANIYHDQRRIPEAIAGYRRALALNPSYIEAHNNLGNLLREAKQLDEALGHLREAVRLDPGYAEAQNNYGVALREAGRMAEAMKHFEAALRANPKFAAAHLNLALSYSLLGRDADAMEHFREARRLNPAIPDLAP